MSMQPDWIAFRAGLQAPEYAGASDAEASDLANAPDPVNRIPITLEVTGILAAISPASLAKLYTRPALSTFRDDIKAQDRAAAVNWITLARVYGDVTEDEKNAVLAYLASAADGPSLAMRTLGVPCSPNDVYAARN